MSRRDREMTNGISSCVLQTLVSGQLMCLRRVDAAKSSADDVELIQQLSCCEKLIIKECRDLLSSSVSDVKSLNIDDVLSHLLETAYNE